MRIPPWVRGYSGGPGGIRTLDLFSAIDEQGGEKEKNAVYYVYFVPKSAYNSLRSLLAVSAYLYPNYAPICTRNMKQGKATRKPVQMGIWCK
jgi:hypothetical protein